MAKHSDEYTTYSSKAVRTEALAYAMGCYQRDLLRGWARWSGADLRGKASKYGAHYARSRAGLIGRLLAKGFAVTEIKRAHGLRTMHISKANGGANG